MKVKLKTIYAGPRGNCGAGCVIELPDDEAKDLIANGYAEKYIPKPKTPKPSADNSLPPEMARLAKIKSAVEDMLTDKDLEADLFTSDGRPKVPALEKRLGFDVTSDERNAAYEALQE